VREQAVGATVVKSVTPGQMVVKIVHDELIAMLGSDGQTIDFNAVPPVAIMMVGLQGSGQTHHHRQTRPAPDPARQAQGADGLARHLPPAARWNSLPCLGATSTSRHCRSWPAKSQRRSPGARWKPAKLGGYDVVLLDTAGRTTLDEEMMQESGRDQIDCQSA